jgi:hypothetical protein
LAANLKRGFVQIEDVLNGRGGGGLHVFPSCLWSSHWAELTNRN